MGPAQGAAPHDIVRARRPVSDGGDGQGKSAPRSANRRARCLWRSLGGSRDPMAVPQRSRKAMGPTPEQNAPAQQHLRLLTADGRANRRRPSGLGPCLT
ncbi:hypothetical protein GCM10023084_37810 [Streptomyces lacrimifluminis]|uniref:Uncharacterized protein n=1 Tax=Streptomyces lacrimifluminis TaxID=1500077 RepID=A0A917L0E6_9ACTN|nr:hypothetical protein GCM10012282_39430 [Streptomyces lacrimifluminis]